MKIKGIFKKLNQAEGLSIEFKTPDGEVISSTNKIKKNKFKLSIKIPNKRKSHKNLVNVIVSDENETAANFTKKGKSVDLSPDNQRFTFTINTKKKKAKLRLYPDVEIIKKPEKTWQIGDIQSLDTTGVSPHIQSIGSGYRLAYPDSGVTKIDNLSNNFQRTNLGTIERISDLTVATPGNGVRRGYYVELNPSTQEREIFTAEISEDWLSLSNPISTGFTDQGSLAWGVPDAVRLNDGRVRLYWVEDSSGGEMGHRENIVSATSDDISGTSFTMDPGQRTTGGYVDFEILQANPGDWIAVMSSTPETLPHQPQGLFVGTSKDGLDWTVNPENLAPPTMSYLDPTGVAIGPNQWQLVLAESKNILGDRDYNLVHTTLTLS